MPLKRQGTTVKADEIIPIVHGDLPSVVIEQLAKVLVLLLSHLQDLFPTLSLTSEFQVVQIAILLKLPSKHACWTPHPGSPVWEQSVNLHCEPEGRYLRRNPPLR